MSQSVKQYIAQYNFNPTNNDELHFKKGDVIIVTQQLDGGWWEGTLNNKTGWFPSNYVIAAADINSLKNALDTDLSTTSSYRHMVLQNIIEMEKLFLTDLSTFIQQFIKPICFLISNASFSMLSDLLNDILSFHDTFLMSIKYASRQSEKSQRIGRVFLECLIELSKLYRKYSDVYPVALNVFCLHKEKILEFLQKKLDLCDGQFSFFITNLFKPFSCLEQYPKILRELERYTTINHADRGDVQRSIELYVQLHEQCSLRRKNKEKEIEILNGVIEKWEGSPLNSLGNVVLLDDVKINNEDNILILFPKILIVLSVNSQLDGFIFQKSYKLEEILIENSANKNDIIICTCDTISFDTEAKRSEWTNAIKEQQSSSKPSLNGQSTEFSCLSKAFLNAQHSEIVKRDLNNECDRGKRYSSAWSASCLKPNKPKLKNQTSIDNSTIKSPKVLRKQTAVSNQFHGLSKDAQEAQDAIVLNVIEAYYKLSKQFLNKKSHHNSRVILPDEEKILTEEQSNNGEIHFEEKTLVDTVYNLKDDVSLLKNQIEQLQRDVKRFSIN